MNLLSSASKIVFILMAIAVIVGLFIGRVDPKDFMILASMVFSYYFTKKRDDEKKSVTICPNQPRTSINSIHC